MVVDRRAGGLHDKHIGTPDRFMDGNRDLPVAEGGHLGFSDRQAQVSRDLAGQGRVGIGGKDLDILPMKIHN